MDTSEEIKAVAELIRRATLKDGIEVDRADPRGRCPVQADSSNTRGASPELTDSGPAVRGLRSSNRDGKRATGDAARKGQKGKEKKGDSRSTE
ncbi:X [Southwest carpet python virus]|uniref:X n=1 Tax=Southwest carpet python virus TaxID=2016402 RepID=A0A2K8MNF4_9MONO|nr:X [Southwest carpet python virus] [Southwest carpet python virus]ATY47623.1 X [Southwest carpet python virus] [Southwest carpet python virus]